MRSLQLLTVGAALACLGASPQCAPKLVDYVVSPEIGPNGLDALDVRLTFQAGPKGGTAIDLPDSDAGTSSLWRYVTDFRVTGAGGVSEAGPAKKIVTSSPGARVTVSYRVVSAFDHDPGPGELDTYKPTIRPRWFWAYGEALFARPEGYDQAHFTWQGPPDFPFASSLQGARSSAMSVDKLTESVSVGGPDLVVQERPIGGASVRFAMIGRYDFTDDAFADLGTRIIAGERAFWGGRERPFLVVLAPLMPVPGRLEDRGEGRADALAIMTTADIPLADLRSVIGHEYFHTWNPGRLGGIPDGAAEPSGYWFSEGFTDFYARRLLLRMGVFQLEDFVADWNAMLRAYATSPVRAEPLARIERDLWTDDSVHKLPYQRGAIIAAIADARLRTLSQGRWSLDDLMRAMPADARRPNAPLAPTLFLEAAKARGVDMTSDVQRIADEGALALLPPVAFGTCIHITTMTVPIFDMGFDWPTARVSHIIAGVDPSSRAYAAGLRNGMTLVKIDAPLGETTKPLTMRIRDAAGERDITYVPAGRDAEVQELSLPPSLTPEQRTRCAAEAAGR